MDGDVTVCISLFIELSETPQPACACMGPTHNGELKRTGRTSDHNTLPRMEYYYRVRCKRSRFAESEEDTREREKEREKGHTCSISNHHQPAIIDPTFDAFCCLPVIGDL